MGYCVAGNQYLPCVEYFARWMYHGKLLLEAHEHYQKRTWRNKTAILGANLPVYLTVPLTKGKHQQMPVRLVRIAYEEPWTNVHIRSLQTAYGQTAFGEEVLSGIFKILEDRPEFLWTLNLSCLSWITDLLKGTWIWEETSTFHLQYTPEIPDFRAGIAVGQAEGSPLDLPQYAQVLRLGKTHQPNLSILDVLCHLGPGAGEYVARYAHKLYEPL